MPRQCHAKASRLADTTDPELTHIHIGYDLSQNERDIAKAKIEEAKQLSRESEQFFLQGEGTPVETVAQTRAQEKNHNIKNAKNNQRNKDPPTDTASRPPGINYPTPQYEAEKSPKHTMINKMLLVFQTWWLTLRLGQVITHYYHLTITVS